ncbi:MAG: single-stranded-DNA-specific exonuclease RecJ [SAR202 cluster bacterium]|jgi:single-stranded-DNA-specific exonuclease|nr:single-stranded-DNA-specific exonuclease RecJ [Chloroflexota bacterium]MDP6422333.1 single-stranded-DNA-specific exonuclease RecJ [SAR202 cluster bacterium]MDP6663190.1 single-stranded-DNA-specific exonuclease RecJ [SAR202 cluster bacterium]MDP6801070.1 single-stranded-DNA-specific exonuclease RecJ [SAR202 cluster bacterium]MQG58888.1 single-stranded-DNA-specific exonuclease RecJ [SAR202 cluster bacterium]|tara:strand:+ start:2023 stop:3705 length:1683 start_codon:yes stop_codon:yes gene_type:complete
MAKNWKIMPPAPQGFEATLGLSRVQAQLLYNRGVRTSEGAANLVDVDSGSSHDPALLPDMGVAVRRVAAALKSGEMIGIFGDFDTDGITGTALMVKALRDMGADATPYLPDRVDEGHGLNPDALLQLRDRGVTLLITVDCGATAVDEIQIARGYGIDTIVTDHHALHGDPPTAVALIDPKRDDSAYPYSELTGVGMAYKLVQAIHEEIGGKPADDLLELVALGTVADVGPLTGENRFFVMEGLARINSSSNPGIRALAEAAGMTMGAIDTSSLSFGLIPRLNAAGRLGSAETSFELLTTDDDSRAHTLAAELERCNRERQALTALGIEEADEQLSTRHPSGIPPIIVVGDKSWKPGILGLIAGRLCEAHYRPAVAVQVGSEECRASARSIAEFDIVDALAGAGEEFVKFGGHARAAGFTIRTDKMRELVRKLTEAAASQVDGLEPRQELTVEMAALPSEVAGRNFQFIRKLAPFGAENPSPVFVARNLQVVDARAVGRGRHLKLKLGDAGSAWDAIAFGQGDQLESVWGGVDIAYGMEHNTWQGRTNIQLVIEDLRPADR